MSGTVRRPCWLTSLLTVFTALERWESVRRVEHGLVCGRRCRVQPALTPVPVACALAGRTVREGGASWMGWTAWPTAGEANVWRGRRLTRWCARSRLRVVRGEWQTGSGE